MEPKRFADGSGMRDEGECEALGFLSWATGWEQVPEMEKLAKDIDMGDWEGIKGYTLGFLHQGGQRGSGQLTGCRDQEGLGQGSEFRMPRAREEKTAGDKRRSKREGCLRDWSLPYDHMQTSYTEIL